MPLRIQATVASPQAPGSRSRFALFTPLLQEQQTVQLPQRSLQAVLFCEWRARTLGHETPHLKRAVTRRQ